MPSGHRWRAHSCAVPAAVPGSPHAATGRGPAQQNGALSPRATQCPGLSWHRGWWRPAQASGALESPAPPALGASPGSAEDRAKAGRGVGGDVSTVPTRVLGAGGSPLVRGLGRGPVGKPAGPWVGCRLFTCDHRAVIMSGLETGGDGGVGPLCPQGERSGGKPGALLQLGAQGRLRVEGPFVVLHRGRTVLRHCTHGFQLIVGGTVCLEEGQVAEALRCRQARAPFAAGLAKRTGRRPPPPPQICAPRACGPRGGFLEISVSLAPPDCRKRSLRAIS